MEVRTMCRVRGMVAALCLGVLQSAHGQAADRVPIEAFFQNPALASGKISPTGDHVALVAGLPDKRRAIVIVDTATLEMTPVAAFPNLDIITVYWISDRRIVFQAADMSKAIGERRRAVARGFFAIDSDGKDFRYVPEFNFTAPLFARNSDEVHVNMGWRDHRQEFEGWIPMRTTSRGLADTRGIARRQDVNWFQMQPWWDYLVGKDDEPRIARRIENGKLVTERFDPVVKKWVPFKLAGRPVAITPDEKLLVRKDMADGREALFQVDLATGTADPEPLVSIKGYDFRGTVLMDDKRLIAIRYTAEAQGTIWYDEKWAEVQRLVDAALPGRVNLLGVPLRSGKPAVLVQSYSDRDPGTWYIFNHERKTLAEIGRSMPDVDPRRMATRELVRYKARDGLEVPAWLTLPHGAARDAKLPMVLMVHGGPYIWAADWEWDAPSQFLASRGYAVLEPQFRGTIGYGTPFYKAGIKQWGQAMQDDLADGARWAIAQGIADGTRVCIAGGSYGGYASMVGLIKEPDLFRCGINAAGVTDLEHMYTAFFSDIDERGRDYLSSSMGDLEKDKDLLQANSVLRRAAMIKQPVLMAYGGTDWRVPISHGRKLLSALKETNKDVEWIEYPGEGHTLLLVANRVDYWRRVETFLGRHIGPGAAAK
jgi:dipeptidyl aminopeptidase/acylaminoacyl peptidase